MSHELVINKFTDFAVRNVYQLLFCAHEMPKLLKGEFSQPHHENYFSIFYRDKHKKKDAKKAKNKQKFLRFVGIASCFDILRNWWGHKFCYLVENYLWMFGGWRESDINSYVWCCRMFTTFHISIFWIFFSRCLPPPPHISNTGCLSHEWEKLLNKWFFG